MLAALLEHGADVLAPLLAHLRKLLEQIFPREPVAFLVAQAGEVVIHILPVAVAVHDLEHYVVAHGHADAGVVKIARVHHHWFSAALGLEGA